MHQEDVFMHYRDPSSRSERGASRKHPPTGPPRRYASLPVIRLRYSASLWPQDKRPCRKDQRTTGRPANGEKASARREGKRTGSPRDAHTEPHGPDRPHPAGTPALQSSACATAQAFDHKTSVPAGKTSERRDDQRTARRQAHREPQGRAHRTSRPRQAPPRRYASLTVVRLRYSASI